MNYSFYLFCKLKDIIIPSHTEYDILFELDCNLYEQYLSSKFNSDHIDEYTCIVNFLLDEKKNIEASKPKQ